MANIFIIIFITKENDDGEANSRETEFTICLNLAGSGGWVEDAVLDSWLVG